jgi:hypothetical protein
MNNTTQNEGMWDRLSAGWTGVKTGAANLGTAVSSVSAGVPLKLTNVQDVKIKQLFNLAQSRMKPFVGKLKSGNIDSRLNAEVEVKKQLLGFIRDFMKMTGEKKPNNVIATLQQPQYKPIADYLLKLGVSVPMSSKKPASTATPTTSTTSTPTPTTASTPTSGTPKDGAIDVTKDFKFDASKGLWVKTLTGVPLNKQASLAKTVAYWNAVKKGTIIPENVTKITYKEFFV